jgi:hypothetical protein
LDRKWRHYAKYEGKTMGPSGLSGVRRDGACRESLADFKSLEREIGVMTEG